MRWQLLRPAALRVREWDDAGVIYDAASGNTHLLDALALELVDLLRLHSWDLDSLVTELSDALPCEAAEARPLLSAKLDQLVRLGLAAAVA